MLDTVFVVDRDNQIVFVSDACEALLGYRADELIGTLITDYMYPDDLAVTRVSIARVINGQPHVDFRNRYIHKDGAIVHILWSVRWSGEDGVRIGVARDVTALTQAEDKLRFLAHHDPLTRLTNRSLFNDRLKSAGSKHRPAVWADRLSSGRGGCRYAAEPCGRRYVPAETNTLGN